MMPSLTVQLAIVGVLLLLTAAISGFVGYDITHKIDAATLAKYQAKYATEKAQAEQAAREEQKTLDDLAYQSASHYLAEQSDIAKTLRAQLARVKHVPNDCRLPASALQLYNDAARGTRDPVPDSTPGVDAAPASVGTAGGR